ncbi:MAG: hypothetical protein ACYSOO_05730, partial [Planctomycetota bacterium]
TKPNAFKRFKAFLYREIRIIHFLFKAILLLSGYFISFISWLLKSLNPLFRYWKFGKAVQAGQKHEIEQFTSQQ